MEFKSFMNVSINGFYFTPEDPDAMYIIAPSDPKNCNLYRFDAGSGDSTNVDIGNCEQVGDTVTFSKQLLAVNMTHGPSAIFKAQSNYLRINHKGKSHITPYCQYVLTSCFLFGSLDLESEIAYVFTITPTLFAGVITQASYNLTDDNINIGEKTLSSHGALAQIDDHNFLIGELSTNESSSPLKVYNTIKQDYIWTGEIERENVGL